MKLLVLSFCVSVFSADDKVSQQFAESNNQFSLKFYEEVAKNSVENFVISPLAAETGVALIQLGSKGPTAKELKDALLLQEDNKIVQAEVKTLLPKLTESDDYALKIVNKIYVKNGCQVRNDFQAAAADFSSITENVDFRENVRAAEIINNWVGNQAEHKITNLVKSEDLASSTSVVSVNACFFRAKWDSPFHKQFSSKTEFYKTPTESVQVETMHNRPHQMFLISRSLPLEAAFLELPFEGHDASLTIILPNQKDALDELESNVDYALNLSQPFNYEILQVAIPKFKIETSIDLKKIFQNLHVNSVFNNSVADLSGIAGEPGDLFISDVVQKSFIEVSENGVGVGGVGATSSVAENTTWELRDFIADHPFIFYIKVKDVIVYVGRVVDPSV